MVTTDSVSEGFHYYSLIIDGVAVVDPSSETFYGMGRDASGIEILFAGDDYYSMKTVPHGDIRIKDYFSLVAFSWRKMYIYTPPGMIQISIRNILYYTFYMAAVKMKEDGLCKAKQI